MARRHLLDSVTSAAPRGPQGADARVSRSDYARRGASLSMMQSLDEMAENSMRLLDGEVVVALDPALIDASFVSDRIGEDEEAYQALLAAIREAGQSSPVLVRPHPDAAGRYMIVYGHRRVRVARELGIAVRAVIKPLEEIAHVVAQGQENSARSDLTFIEKALFARKLARSGMAREVIRAALSIDDTLASRMLSIAEGVPDAVLDAVGSARGVGRDRWEELKKLLALPGKAQLATEEVAREGFGALPPGQRFDMLLAKLKLGRRPKAAPVRSAPKSWTMRHSKVAVSARDGGDSYVLALKAKDISGFGNYLSQQLDRLFDEFVAGGNVDVKE